MKRIGALVFVALLAACAPKHGKMSAAPAPSATPGQTINIDPSVAPGMVAAVNTVVFDSGGTYLWTKYAVSNTAWRPVPTSAIVASDPSQPPGLKAAIGFVVTKNDGSASWVKSGSSDTAWSTNPGGGGVPDGGLAISTVDGGLITGNGTVASPLNAVAQFGSDTTVSINNSASTPKSAWEQIVTLTDTGVGTESSQAVVKLMTGGAQGAAMTLGPAQVLFPAGTSGAPGVAVGSTGYGLSAVVGSSQVQLSAAGAAVLNAQSGTSGPVINLNALGSFMISGSVDVGIKRNGSADFQTATGHDSVIGADGALSTSAAAGHMEVPTCAGTPTGTVTTRSGKAALLVDTTDNKLCWSVGSGTWKCVSGT